MSDAKTFPCPHCGEPVIEGQLYCRSCNAWLAEERGDTLKEIPEEAPGWKKALWVQVGILVVLGVMLLFAVEKVFGALSPLSNILFTTAVFIGFLLYKTGETPHVSGGVSTSTSYKAAGFILLYGFAIVMLAQSPTEVEDFYDVVDTFEDALYMYNLRSLAIAFTVPLAVIACIAGRSLGKSMRVVVCIVIFAFFIGILAYFGDALEHKNTKALTFALPVLYYMLYVIPLMMLAWVVSGSPLGNWGAESKRMAIIAPVVILIVGFFLANHPWLFLSKKLSYIPEDKLVLGTMFSNIAVYILPIMALIASAVHLKTISAQKTLLFDRLKWSHVTGIIIIVWGFFMYVTQGRLVQSMALFFTLPLAIIAQQIMAKKEEVIY